MTMIVYYLKHLFIGFLLVLMVQDDVLGQQKAKETQRHQERERLRRFEFLKNICCNFISDHRLTRSTKEAIQQDAYALAKEVVAAQIGDPKIYKNLIEEFVTYIYQDLVYIRLTDSIELAELNNLAIHKAKNYIEYSTSITLDYTSLDDDWIFDYSITFKEGEEWKTKHWKIAMEYCTYNYTITTNNAIVLPDAIKKIASEHAAQELRHD